MTDKKPLALALMLTLGVAASAAAYTQLYRFQYCSSVPDKAERLECYDNYASELGLSPAKSVGGISATQKVKGKWTIRAETTVDSNSLFVFTEGNIAYSHSVPKMVPTLVARCDNRTTELFVSYGSYFPVEVGPEEKSALYARRAKSTGKDQVKPVSASVKFDGGKPLNLSMRLSVDGRSFFFPNPVSYIRQLRSHKMLEFRFETPEHPPMDTVFNLDGMEEALEPLRKQCEW